MSNRVVEFERQGWAIIISARPAEWLSGVGDRYSVAVRKGSAIRVVGAVNAGEREVLIDALKVLCSGQAVVEIGNLSLADAVRSLPSGFIEMYSTLFTEAVRVDQGGARSDAVEVAGAKRVTRLSTNQTETRGGSKGSRKSGQAAELVRNQRLFRFKGRIDKRLRRMTREIKVELMGAESVDALRRCTVCRTFGEPDWLYCPRDGKPMESYDPDRKR